MRNFSPLTEGRTLALGYYHQGGRKLRRYQSRGGRKPCVIVLHHAALFTNAAMQAELLRTTRTLSCNYFMGEDALLYGVVSERFKANTTAHPIDFEAITIEIANDGGEKGAGNPASWFMSDERLEAIARWVADVTREYGMPIDRKHVTVHRDYRNTRCPGEYLMGQLDDAIGRARAIAGQGASKPAPAKPTKPSTPGGLPAAGVAMLQGVGVGDHVKLIDWTHYDDARLSDRVAVKTGTYRIDGISYEHRGGIEPSLHLSDGTWVHVSAVRGVVDEEPASKPAPARKSAAQLADEVLDGKWGNGAERRRRLEAAGHDYSAVQAAVNAKLGGSAPRGKSIGQMAAEVIAGKHGNGHANRRRSLGVGSATYAKVRAEVNRRV